MNAPNMCRARLSLATLSAQAGDRRRGWQIGPRLKLGGSVGRAIGQVTNPMQHAVTEVGHTVGKVADNPWTQAALMAALTATGAGAPAAAAWMAATKGGGALLKPGGNIGQGVQGAVRGAVQGGGAAALGTLASKVPGVAAVGGRAKDLLGHIPGASTVGRVANSVGGRAKSIVSGLPGMGGSSGGDVFTDESVSPDQGLWQNIKNEAGRVAGRLAHGQSPISVGGQDPLGGGGGGGDVFTDGPSGSGGGGGNSFLDKLLLGGSVAAGTADALDRRNFRNKAADYATAGYDAKAPLRARALALLQQDQPRDMSSMVADPGNVYDRQRRARMLATPPAA